MSRSFLQSADRWSKMVDVPFERVPVKMYRWNFVKNYASVVVQKKKSSLGVKYAMRYKLFLVKS